MWGSFSPACLFQSAEDRRKYVFLGSGCEFNASIRSIPCQRHWLNSIGARRALASSHEMKWSNSDPQKFGSSLLSETVGSKLINGLDAPCKRYSIDNSHRALHGALLDARILAVVYLATTGGRARWRRMKWCALLRRPVFRHRVKWHYPRRHAVGANAEEVSALEQFMTLLRKASGGKVLWNQALWTNRGLASIVQRGAGTFRLSPS